MKSTTDTHTHYTCPNYNPYKLQHKTPTWAETKISNLSTVPQENDP